MILNENQIAFLLELIEPYEGYGNFTTADRNYSITGEEIDQLITFFENQLKKLKCK